MENNWLKYSQAIADQALYIMRQQKITQTALAARMNRTQQNVSRLLSGKENLTLETISLLEKSLGTSLSGYLSSSYGNLLMEDRTPYGTADRSSTLKSVSSAEKITTRLETGDRPIIVNCNDACRYLCKMPSFWSGAYNLARELIGTYLAGIWGICDNDLALVTVLPEHAAGNDFDATLPGLGRKWVDNATEVKDSCLLFIQPGSENTLAILKIALFDLWLCNEDRLNNNLNLLYSTQDNRLIAIDHAGIFNTSFSVPLTPLSVSDSVLYSNLFAYVSGGGKISGDTMDRIISFFREKSGECKLSTNKIWSAIPRCWNIGKTDFDSMMDFIFSEDREQETIENFNTILEQL